MEWRTLILGGILLIATALHQVSAQNPRILDTSSSELLNQKQDYHSKVSSDSPKFHNKPKKLTVIYESLGLDRAYQMELLRAVQIALDNLNEYDVAPSFIDISKANVTAGSHLRTSVQWLVGNKTQTVVSLVGPETLSDLISIYDGRKARSPHLTIVTPRLVARNPSKKSAVKVLCLQMSELAVSVALLNRIEKVGVKTLIPVLDQGNMAQLEQLNYFLASGQGRTEPIQFTKPIFIREEETSEELSRIFDDETNTGTDLGMLLLATRGSHTVMQVANQSKNLLQMRWFSPNFLEHEEWAHRGSGSSPLRTNATFGIYSVHYVGSRGWENPSRRKTLRELNRHSDPSPRLLSSVLAYDAAWVAMKTVKSKNPSSLSEPLQGLSGEVSFDGEGYRQEGVYFGVSAVPELISPLVSLLQPSTWILEDVVSVVETIEGQVLITDYNVATSSMLTKEELTRFSSSTSNNSDCEEHLMEIMTHDPFNQLPSTYLFNKENLPHHLLIPNQHGYGITFMCRHKDESRTTMKIACTPGGRFSDPVKCFRSHFAARQKRQASSRYRAYYDGNGYGNAKPGSPALYYPENYLQGSKFSARDDSSMYGAPPPAVTYGPFLTTRFDTPIVSDDTSVTASPAPPVNAPPAAKLPELRQVLKAAKPFVGSCVGAATGCAMCVLVLGRLPLGTLPPACTGPCFVGVFGSCGALLGRAFSETTVVCTELFRQGYLDIDTFLADAQFGQRLIEQSPRTHKGYKLLATPLVERMRESKAFTEIVSKVALPWAKYMKYSMGYSEEFSYLGFTLNLVGTPICFLAGTIQELFETGTSLESSSSTSATDLSSTALLSLILMSLIYKKYRQSSLREKY